MQSFFFPFCFVKREVRFRVEDAISEAKGIQWETCFPDD